MGRDSAREQIDLWVAEAKAGGPGARLAARRAAAAAEWAGDHARALSALKLAARLEPLDPAPRLAAARLHAEAGDLAAAQAEAEAVLGDSIDHAARARAAFMLGEFARARGESGAARTHYETTLRIEDALLAADRANPTAARWYARARGRIAELDAAMRQAARAQAGAEAALSMLRACAAQIGEPPALAADIADAEMRLAALEIDDARPASALRRLQEAIGRYEALALTEPEEPHWRAVLSDAWALAAEAELGRGEAKLARAAMDKALQTRIRLAVKHANEVWPLAGLWRTRAALLAALNDAPGAAACLAQARALAEKLCARNGEAQSRFLIHTLLDQADHALRNGALALARDSADFARQRAEFFAHAPNGDPTWLGEVGACWDRLGETARLARAGDKALEAFARACEFRRLACERAPDNQRFMRGLAAALVKLGDAALEANAPETARAAVSESVRLRLTLAEAAPDDAIPAYALATALERLGLAALACGDPHAARGAWEDELALADRLFADHDIEGQRFRAIVESHLVSIGGAESEALRNSALARFDDLARAGVLTGAEAALRKKLWGG
jgi:tetratricopeptide (TPR) repeat protein